MTVKESQLLYKNDLEKLDRVLKLNVSKKLLIYLGGFTSS